MAEPIAVDTLILVVTRIGLALGCRKLLSTAFTPTLRELTAEEPLSILPLPTTQPDTPYSDTDDEFSRHASPVPTMMELSDMPPKVLKLNHGRPMAPVKRATRGLGRIARGLFCICCAEACNILVIVACHIADILNARSRQVNFSISLHLILALILVVMPMLQCLLLTYRSSARSKIAFKSRLVVACIPFGLYAFAFTFIPPYITTVRSDTPGEDWEGEGWLASSLGRVVVLGIVALAGLSGFGAVRTAWNFIEHLAHGRSSTLEESDITRAEQSLSRTRQELAAKEEELSRGPTPSKSWVGKLLKTSGSELELEGLRNLERQMGRSLSVLRKRKDRQAFSQTFLGQVYNLIGYCFAIYCAARVIMCVPALFYQPIPDTQVKGSSNGDWISYLLALALSEFPSVTIDVALWSRSISLLLTGVLILSSMAQILRSVGRILRLSSKTAGSSFLLLSLGQLFSVYVVSLIIQMRASLQSTDEEASPLNTLPDFRTFGRLFDLVFLCAAVGTALYRFIALKID